MTIDIHSSDDGHVLTINMAEKFSFDLCAELHSVYADKTFIM